MLKRIIFTLCFMFLFCYIGYVIFSPLYYCEHVIIDYGITPFDICSEQPTLWKYCKYWFIFTYLFTSFFIANFLFHLSYHLFQQVLPHPFPKKVKRKEIKKKKGRYSLIDPCSSPLQLELLLRRK